MSKFADKLKRSFGNINQAIGFRKPSADEEIPSILIMVDIGSTTLKKIKDLVSGGVDAFLVENVENNLDKIGKTTGNIPLGIIFAEGEDITADNTSGDFIVFGLKARADLPLDKNMGKLLRVTEPLAPGMIKAINDLDISVDGVVVDFKDNPLDIQFILTCHLFNDLLNKPLLVRVYKNDISESEMKSLGAAGVHGLWLSNNIPVSSIKKIKKDIAALPAGTRKDKRTVPLIPGMNFSQQETEEIEDDE
jgi:hypothetical protein